MKWCILVIISIYCFLQIITRAEGLRQDKPKCKQPLNLYDNLKCKPKYTPGKLCPDCYDCSQINPKINKCYYRGKYYKIGQQIPDDVPVPSCYAACYCNEDLTFSCAIIDCAYPEVPDGCYALYGFDNCCSTGYNCPDNNTLVCNADGFQGYEGQTFSNPKDECSLCECAEGVTGNPGDPHCRKYPCDIELTQSNHILGYCAPVYGYIPDCCPYDYMCPRDDDNFYSCASHDSSCSKSSSESSSISSSESNSLENPDSIGPRVKCDDKKACKQCRYGKSCYPIGTKFSREETNPLEPNGDWHQFTDCECVIPPYFTCTRTYDPIYSLPPGVSLPPVSVKE